MEEKWLNSEITRDIYDRWYATYNYTRLNLKDAISRLSTDIGEAFHVLKRNLDVMTDISGVYNQDDTLRKREFINLVFDTNLYYENPIYRTLTMSTVFYFNHLEMKDK
ncbi:hypothetical protein D3C85_613940 [compost metagenome]